MRRLFDQYPFVFSIQKSKTNRHYTWSCAEASSAAHLRGLAPGQHNFKETSQQWQVLGDIASY